MRLVAIYNVWDDWDLFQYSYKNIAQLVDGVICIYSNSSNFGQRAACTESLQPDGPAYFNFEPDLRLEARTNETAKRDYGLQKARELGYTHFLTMDADEFYEPEEFLKEIPRFWNNPNLNGLVCRVKCYFKSPTLTIGYDTTLVPFIHKLEGANHEFNRNYPFAWTKINGVQFTREKQIRIDPTRSLNFTHGIEWSDITMHHMSWVRRDVKKKIRNSTARQNIERSSIVRDYANAKDGYFCEFYGKPLQVTPNIFGLPEINDTTICPSTSARTDSTD
jgi:hypothetical protein